MSTIILCQPSTLERLRLRSLADDALYVACYRPWVARQGIAITLPKLGRDLLIAMLVRGQCSMSELVDAIYADDPNGGPEFPQQQLSQVKYSLVSISTALGLHIGKRGNWHVAEFAE